MYDLTKDSEDYYLIRQLCISNQPILFYGVNIYQPLIKDLMRIKESDYLHIVNMFRFKDDIFDNKMNGLDYYLNLSLKNSIYSNYILLAFSIFFKVNINDINAEFDNSNRGNICINQNGNICIINKDNFNELCEIICIITGLSRLDKEDIKPKKVKYKCKDPRFSDRVQQYFKEKEKYIKSKKNNIENNILTKEEKAQKFYNIYVFMGNRWRSFDNVNNLNIYQLNEAYIYEGAEINSQYDYGIYVSGYAKENFKPRDTRIEIAK